MKKEKFLLILARQANRNALDNARARNAEEPYHWGTLPAEVISYLREHHGVCSACWNAAKDLRIAVLYKKFGNYSDFNVNKPHGKFKQIATAEEIALYDALKTASRFSF